MAGATGCWITLVRTPRSREGEFSRIASCGEYVAAVATVAELLSLVERSTRPMPRTAAAHQ
jgi:hypothetical protein